MSKSLLQGSILTLLFLSIFIPVAFVSAQSVQKPIDPSNFDTTVQPSVDFFKFANGGWIARNPIPADQSVWGSFNELQEHNYAILHEILENAATDKNAPDGSTKRRVGDFYMSGMDSDAIEANGVKPLTEEMNAIQSMHDGSDLQNEIARFHTLGIGVPFAFFSDQDAKKSTDVIAHISQSGLGLPDRDYYTKKDANSEKIRTEYIGHVKKMFILLGDDSVKAAAAARGVMEMETAMAKASMTRVERRDPNATYHKMTLDELSSLTPAISWKSYLTNIGFPNVEIVNVGMPSFMKKIDSMITNVPMDNWKDYFRWHYLRSTANYLTRDFVNEEFHFSGMILTGVKENRPRWKRVLESVNRGIGEDLGQLYVEKAFTPEAKAHAREMVMNLKAALRDRIEHLEWMSDETKQ
jgi:putative endopeptidase